MKTKVCLIGIAVLILCGCQKPEDTTALKDQINNLQIQNDKLSLEVSNLQVQISRFSVSTNSITSADIASLKLWTLDKLEQSEMAETERRYESESNLQNLIFKVGQTAIEAKQ